MRLQLLSVTPLVVLALSSLSTVREILEFRGNEQQLYSCKASKSYKG